MLWGEYNVGTPIPYALFCLTAMVIASSVFYAWIRLKSGSIWPCVLMHATHNAIIQKFFDRVTIENSYTKYFTTKFGIGLVLTTSLIAAYCWKRSGELESRAAFPEASLCRSRLRQHGQVPEWLVRRPGR